MQILLPMAGAGSRFVQQGYKKPKPLIDVLGKTMIENVVHNLGCNHDYIFIVQKNTISEYLVELVEATEVSNSSIFLTTNGLKIGRAHV